MLVAYIAMTLPVRLAVLWRMGLYARLWRYAGQSDLEHLCVACAVLGGIGIGAGFAVGLIPGAAFTRVPLSIVLMDALLGALVVTLPRLAMRRGGRWSAGPWGRRAADAPQQRRVLIAGAGGPAP